MKLETDERSFLSPLRNKVIAAFLLAVVAIVLAAGTTYFSFNNLLTEVDELSAPNEKLLKINRLFEFITQLDQRQRAEAIRNPFQPYKQFLRQSQALTRSVDSLLLYTWTSNQQRQRIQTMKQILTRRDYYLIEYLKLRSVIYNNRNQQQFDSLANALLTTLQPTDSTVTTKQQKMTTTTYLTESPKKPNFFSRLFGGKKKETPTPLAEVKEELKVTIDTLAIHQSDSTVKELGRLMKTMEQTKQLQNKQLLQRELELINTNVVLMNHLLSVLQEVENEEILAVERNNAEAVSLVKSSSRHIGIIITVFFLLAAVLIFLILVDISKSNYYRLQLVESKKEAERLGQVKQRFLSNMSHEIRSPLQSIIGYSEQLTAQKNDESSVHAIQNASKHLLQIANEVLDYSRLDSNTFSLELVPFRLSEVIAEVAASTQILADQKKIVFEWHNESLPDFLLMGDPFRLKQLLYNLLSNAIKFTTEGKVTLRAKAHIDLYITCTFSVLDTGIGMDATEVTKIFGEFEQAHPRIHEKFGGSGLGLAIVKKLVTLLNGEISVTSEPGRGSEFTVELKFERARVNALASVQPKDKEIEDVQQNIVLIDDDQLILNLCGIILRKNQTPFVALSQPKLALTHDFSNATIVFIDIRMPEINGASVAQEIRKKYPILKLVAFTAHALPEEQKELLASGFDQLLLKPFLEKDFLRIVYGQSDLGRFSSAASSFDLEGLKKMVDYDDALFQSIINDFCMESKEDAEKIQSAMLTNDPAQVGESIHKLVSRTGQLGLNELSEKLESIEIRLSQNTPLDSLKINVGEIQKMLEESISRLESEYLSSLATNARIYTNMGIRKLV
jgi:signal transduction histidine kinase/CheY-like chemotaxis protein